MKVGAILLTLNELWNSSNQEDWLNALNRYWKYVKPTHLELEKKFDSLDYRSVQVKNELQWYLFLKNEYFRWKYTAPNRYATTSQQLSEYEKHDNLAGLHDIKKEIFAFNRENELEGLRIASKTKGLGIAGASGLLAVLFPSYFGTVDQFVVKALREIDYFKENPILKNINPNNITIKQGAFLIQVMKEKARELNRQTSTNFWTPRKIDMILWSYR
jgi:hypothetical protein